MAEKENNQRRESTINKYFSKTADAYRAWAEEDEEERNYLQIAAETTGDADENGTKVSIFILLTMGKPVSLLAELLKQWKRTNSFARSLLRQRRCI